MVTPRGVHMQRRPCSRRGLAFALTLALSGVTCAHRHRPAPTPAPSPASSRLEREAAALPPPRFEEDFLAARLVFQALPLASPQRGPLRVHLLRYLLEPVAALAKRRDLAARPVGADLPDQLLGSLRDALDLLDPEVAWRAAGEDPGPGAVGSAPLDATEEQLLRTAAHVVLRVLGPRGDEQAAALALCVLATLEPAARARWETELDTLLEWAEHGRLVAVGESGPEGLPSARRLLESTLDHWPAPLVLRRLSIAHGTRQAQLARLLRRPLGGGQPRQGDELAEQLLRDGDRVPASAATLAAVHLRARRPDLAAAALAPLRDGPGDDAELRALLAPLARGSAPSVEDFLKLARRFLPRAAPLGGTSGDRIDERAALRVLELGYLHHPGAIELLVLHSRVARLAGAPMLGFRLLEEAEAAMERAQGSAADREALSRELIDLAFALLRVHVDPENIEPLLKYASDLRARLDAARRRFGPHADWLSVDAVDLELARSFVDAGLVERARPIYDRVTSQGGAASEVMLQIAGVLLKTGDVPGATRLLRTTIDHHKPDNPPHETIGFVETQARLLVTLGQAYDAGGRPEEAAQAYRGGARAWERLMTEHFRRRNATATAEALVELGKLYYLLGKRDEGIEKFLEAIALADGRDQSYIDPLAFLVQRGEVEPAVDIYRVLISRPGQTVSEYVKVYASLWILDLTRRSARPPEASAMAYLEALASRDTHLRPMRAAVWYVELARYATGRISYEELLPRATSAGRKAELFFYQAMRLLHEGRRDEARALWQAVLQTNMLSFFEYEMASRYLRVGAPTAPVVPRGGTIETI